MIFDELTQLCLRWSYAHLSAGLQLGTYPAEVPVHIGHMELGCAMMLFCERSFSVIGAKSSNCHTVALALMFSTSERCLFSQATLVMQLVSSQMKQ